MRRLATEVDRRLVLAGLLTWPLAVEAHPGHGTAKVVATADVARFRSGRVALLLTLFNMSTEPATLEYVEAAGAGRVPVGFAVIAPGGLTEVPVTLEFEGPVPGVFTAILDFGAAGQAPVLVQM